MSNQPLPFIVKITHHLPKAEAGFMAGVLIGVMLMYAGMGSTLLNLSLVGLAATFFLWAYRPIEIPDRGTVKNGFLDMLTFTITPKVGWISCAVVLIGVLFYFNGTEGTMQMLYIGGSTMVVVTLILVFGIVSGVKHIDLVTPLLYRVIPLMLLAAYIYFM